MDREAHDRVALRFSKMHGLGNDFVIVDCRAAPLALDAAAIRRLGDRHFGVGFDQLLTIERARDPGSAFAYGIWNTDGSRARQCGNGVRCVARWLAREGALAERTSVRLDSPSGPVAIELQDDGRVRAAMGQPDFALAGIPFIADHETRDARYRIDVAGREVEIGAVSIGNPHALVEVDDVDAAPVEALGPQIEHASAFPERCNVGFAEVRSRSAIRLRVWERGVGETLACGSGASAAVAVLRRRGRVDNDVAVSVPGGELEIRWNGPGETLWMTGPATFVFEGEWHG
jgi:diaminopimelate epimerase